MPVIANTHPKGGVGKTTSSVNIVGEMKSDTVDLDTHTGLSIILGLRPEGKEISVKVPKTVDELIEIMTPYKKPAIRRYLLTVGDLTQILPVLRLPLQTALLSLQKTP